MSSCVWLITCGGRSAWAFSLAGGSVAIEADIEERQRVLVVFEPLRRPAAKVGGEEFGEPHCEPH